MGYREARVNAGLSVIEVAQILGVTDVAIYNWETNRGYPRIPTLIKLARLYGVTVDELLSDEVNE